MSGIDELVTWLRAQIDEDERVAQFAMPRRGEEWNASYGHAFVILVDVDRHSKRHSPARVLREVQAKRRILEVATSQIKVAEILPPEHAQQAAARAQGIIQLLAVPYADRPGYRDEWRP